MAQVALPPRCAYHLPIVKHEAAGAAGVASVEMELGKTTGDRTIRFTLGGLSLMMAASAVSVQVLAPLFDVAPESVNAAAFGMLLGAVAHATALWQWR